MSYKEIAKIYGVTHNPILHVLKKLGLWEPRRNKQCNNLTTGEAAYLAGIVDGEGCIYAGTSGKEIRLLLQIHMTSQDVIRWIHEITGVGSVKEGQTPKGIKSWHWAVSMRQAAPVLNQIIPFLIVKREQAKLALELIELRRSTCRTPYFNLNDQLALVNEIKQLKQLHKVPPLSENQNAFTSCTVDRR